MKNTPIVSVVGYSNSGKTTFVVKLIAELKSRGYKIATIKHHHSDYETDAPGKDTWKHAQAGSDTVILAGPQKICMTEYLSRELTLDEIAARINDVDLIITEGFKKERKPKIEVFRPELYEKIISPPEELLAVVSEQPIDGVKTFGFDDAAAIADLLSNHFKLFPSKDAGGKNA